MSSGRGGRGGYRGGGGRSNSGRGRGGSSSRPNARPNSQPSSSQHSSQSKSRSSTPSSSQPKLVNGMPGAEAHTVSESDRIAFTQLLINFREDFTRDKITMSTDLTNTERKFIHQLAGQLGLKSKSSGKGENRCITISRLSDAKKIAGMGVGGGNSKDEEGPGDEVLPVLKVGRKGLDALRTYVKSHPPSAVEKAESYCTGSSLVSMVGNHGPNSTGSSTKKDVNTASYDEDDAGDDIVMASAGVNSTPAEEEVNILQALDELNISSTSHAHRKAAPRKHIDMSKRKALHHAAQKAKAKSSAYKQMQSGRRKLPAYSYRNEVCDVVYNNRVIILSGDTGCGKSTQVPQFLLDDEIIGPTASIVVTQPRRISAISVAERVASERGEECGKRGGLIGYSVRLESCACPSTQCVFVTPGVLLRRFQSSPDLSGVTHVLIDEIHERDKYTEFLMIALRNLMTLRDDLHVILMSATIQTHELSVYWSGVGKGGGVPPTVPEAMNEDNDNIDDALVGSDVPAEVSIPGRTFPVQEFFLEDILEMTGYVNDDGQRLGDKSEMDRIDAELGALLQQGAGTTQTSKSRGGRGKKRKEVPQSIGDGSSLTCIMCGRAGFRSAEELGDHVALCDGGGGITMEALEEKVRTVNTANVATFDKNIAAATAQFEDYEDNDPPPTLEDYDIEDDGGDDIAGLNQIHLKQIRAVPLSSTVLAPHEAPTVPPSPPPPTLPSHVWRRRKRC